MGFFTRESSHDRAKRQQRPSLADPPNVFYTPSSPPLPARPATAAPAVNAPCPKPHVAFSQPRFGAAPPPPGWGPPAPGAAPGPRLQPPVVVNHHHQHYYIGACQPQQAVQAAGSGLGRWTGSLVDLGRGDGLYAPLRGSRDAVYGDICARFDDVMTLIDRERYAGDERDLFVCQSAPQPSQSQPSLSAPRPPDQPSSTDRWRNFGGGGSSSSKKPSSSEKRLPGHADPRKPQTCDVAAAVVSGSYFSKVDLYANSRLPVNLPPLALYALRPLSPTAQYRLRPTAKRP